MLYFSLYLAAVLLDWWIFDKRCCTRHRSSALLVVVTSPTLCYLLGAAAARLFGIGQHRLFRAIYAEPAEGIHWGSDIHFGERNI